MVLGEPDDVKACLHRTQERAYEVRHRFDHVLVDHTRCKQCRSREDPVASLSDPCLQSRPSAEVASPLRSQLVSVREEVPRVGRPVLSIGTDRIEVIRRSRVAEGRTDLRVAVEVGDQSITLVELLLAVVIAEVAAKG